MKETTSKWHPVLLNRGSGINETNADAEPHF